MELAYRDRRGAGVTTPTGFSENLAGLQIPLPAGAWDFVLRLATSSSLFLQALEGFVEHLVCSVRN